MLTQTFEGPISSVSRTGGGVEVTVDILSAMTMYSVAFIVPVKVGDELTLGQRLRFTVEKVERTVR